MARHNGGVQIAYSHSLFNYFNKKSAVHKRINEKPTIMRMTVGVKKSIKILGFEQNSK